MSNDRSLPFFLICNSAGNETARRANCYELIKRGTERNPQARPRRARRVCEAEAQADGAGSRPGTRFRSPSRARCLCSSAAPHTSVSEPQRRGSELPLESFSTGPGPDSVSPANWQINFSQLTSTEFAMSSVTAASGRARLSPSQHRVQRTVVSPSRPPDTGFHRDTRVRSKCGMSYVI